VGETVHIFDNKATDSPTKKKSENGLFIHAFLVSVKMLGGQLKIEYI
jgi:hypothetical protein